MYPVVTMQKDMTRAPDFRISSRIYPWIQSRTRSSKMDSALPLPASQLLCFSNVHIALYPIVCLPILQPSSLGTSLCHTERSYPNTSVARKRCFLHSDLEVVLPSSQQLLAVHFFSSPLCYLQLPSLSLKCSVAFDFCPCFPPPSPDPCHYS